MGANLVLVDCGTAPSTPEEEVEQEAVMLVSAAGAVGMVLVGSEISLEVLWQKCREEPLGGRQHLTSGDGLVSWLVGTNGSQS